MRIYKINDIVKIDDKYGQHEYIVKADNDDTGCMDCDLIDCSQVVCNRNETGDGVGRYFIRVDHANN